MLTVQH